MVGHLTYNRKPRNPSLSNMVSTILLLWLRPRKPLSLSLPTMLIPLNSSFSFLPFAAKWVCLMSSSRARLASVLWSIRRLLLLWLYRMSRVRTNVILLLSSVQPRPICTLHDRLSFLILSDQIFSTDKYEEQRRQWGGGIRGYKSTQMLRKRAKAAGQNPAAAHLGKL